MAIYKKYEIYFDSPITRARWNGLKTRRQIVNSGISVKPPIKIKHILINSNIFVGDKIGIIKYDVVKKVIYNFGSGYFKGEMDATKTDGDWINKHFKNAHTPYLASCKMEIPPSPKNRAIKYKVYDFGDCEIRDYQFIHNGHVLLFKEMKKFIEDFKNKGWKIRKISPKRIDNY